MIKLKFIKMNQYNQVGTYKFLWRDFIQANSLIISS